MPYASGQAFQSLGQNLMGIGRLVGDRRRMDEERERMEERQRMQDQLAFIEAGGGYGPPPEITTTVPGTRASVDLGPTNLIPEPTGPGLSPDALIPEPQLQTRRPEGIQSTTQDPRYAAVGPGYVMRPEAARQQRVGRIGDAVGRLGEDATRPTAMAELLAEGVNPSGLMDVQGDNWERAAEFYRENGILPAGYHRPAQGAGEQERYLPPQIALALVENRYAIRDELTGEVIGYNADATTMAREVAELSGATVPEAYMAEPTGAPPPPTTPAAGDDIPEPEGPSRQSFWGGVKDFFMPEPGGPIVPGGAPGAAPLSDDWREATKEAWTAPFRGDGDAWRGARDIGRRLMEGAPGASAPSMAGASSTPGGADQPTRSPGQPPPPSDREVQIAVREAGSLGKDELRATLLRAGATQEQVDRYVP